MRISQQSVEVSKLPPWCCYDFIEVKSVGALRRPCRLPSNHVHFSQIIHRNMAQESLLADLLIHSHSKLYLWNWTNLHTIQHIRFGGKSITSHDRQLIWHVWTTHICFKTYFILEKCLTQKFNNPTEFRWRQGYILTPISTTTTTLIVFFTTHVDMKFLAISIRLWLLQSLLFWYLGTIAYLHVLN